MLSSFYKFILRKTTPFIKWVGKIHSPWSRKLINGKFYYTIREKVEPGTVLLTTTYGELSNLINPVSVKHGAIYIGKTTDDICYVTEAVGSGVVKTDLVTFLTTKDVVIVLKPNFLTETDKTLLTGEAVKFLGVPYDYLFEHGKKALYCFENIVSVFKALRPELNYKKNEIVKGKAVYDSSTFLSDKELFTVLFDSRKMKL